MSEKQEITSVDGLAEPVQQPLPLAFVHGEAVIERPEDLYIPPDALEVILEAFEGPLDLLLYLIRKQKFDIETLPITNITKQYMEYVEVMKDIKLELAAEYLVMAAILAEVKSRVLLPKRASEEDEEADPRAELIRRLQEYEAIKLAAQSMETMPRRGRDFHVASVAPSETCEPIRILPDISLQELVVSFQNAMQRAATLEHHHIEKESLSTRERMSLILDMIQAGQFTSFSSLFKPEEGKQGVVVTFLAVLELAKEKMIEVVQAQPYSEVHVRISEYEKAAM